MDHMDFDFDYPNDGGYSAEYEDDAPIYATRIRSKRLRPHRFITYNARYGNNQNLIEGELRGRRLEMKHALVANNTLPLGTLC
jgi:hypothetical protein